MNWRIWCAWCNWRYFRTCLWQRVCEWKSDDSSIDERDETMFAGGEGVGATCGGTISSDCSGRDEVSSAANGEIVGRADCDIVG